MDEDAEEEEGFLKKQTKRFFFGKPEDCQSLKITLGFPVGLAVGFVFHLLLIEPMRIPASIRRTLGTGLGFLLAAGFSLSVQVRCMVCLLIPMFFSKEGRAYVSTFAISLLISGPVSNIISNARETTRSLSCSLELLENHTRAKTELQMQPLQDLVTELQKDGFLLHETMASIDKAFQPVRKELTDGKEVEKLRKNTDAVDATQDGSSRTQEIDNRYKGLNSAPKAVKAEKSYEKKLDFRCEDVFSVGVERCEKEFRDMEEKCLDELPIIGYLLCLPLKLSIICQLIRLVPGIIGLDCESVNVVDPGIGETFVSTDETLKDFESNFQVKMKYKVEHTKEDVDVVTAKEVAMGIEREFSSREVLVTYFLNMLQLLLGFAFILLFKQAYSYTKGYISDFRYDNIYITSYFKKIDARRDELGKSTLLPLKKMEARKIVEPTTVTLRSAEKSKIIKGSIRLLINVFVISMVILVDKLLFGVLDIIRRNSFIAYRQTGRHDVDVKVFGNGFVASIVRSILKGFESRHSIDNISTNFNCLPKPITLSTGKVVTIYGIYLLIWVLLLLEAYGLRLRRLICSFFFRKREKARVLFLYNDTLKRRKSYLVHARRQVRKKARKAKLVLELGFLPRLRQMWPRFFGWLRNFDFAKEKCLICGDVEDESFYRCESEGCRFGYCGDCCDDIGGKCYACTPPEAWEPDSGESSDSGSESD